MYTVVLDANVLVPMPLCDLLLRLAEVELFRPVWSPTILEELRRTLVTKLGQPEDRVARRIAAMQTAFPRASVDGYEQLIPSLTNHPKDRHVLAAAIRGGADAIVTSDARGFLSSALEPYDIEAVTPDDFLQDQLTLDPDRTVAALRAQLGAYRRPRFSISEFYRALSATAPTFVSAAMVEHGARMHRVQPGEPLPFEARTPAEAFQAFFPDAEPDDHTPLGAAFRWFIAVKSRRTDVAAAFSLRPDVWDFDSIAAMLEGWGMAQDPVPSLDEPDDIVHIKLLPVSTTGRLFDEVLLEEFKIITVVRVDQGVDTTWRVWGLAENHAPSAAAVHGTED